MKSVVCYTCHLGILGMIIISSGKAGSARCLRVFWVILIYSFVGVLPNREFIVLQYWIFVLNFLAT